MEARGCGVVCQKRVTRPTSSADNETETGRSHNDVVGRRRRRRMLITSPPASSRKGTRSAFLPPSVWESATMTGTGKPMTQLSSPRTGVPGPRSPISEDPPTFQVRKTWDGDPVPDPLESGLWLCPSSPSHSCIRGGRDDRRVSPSKMTALGAHHTRPGPPLVTLRPAWSPDRRAGTAPAHAAVRCA